MLGALAGLLRVMLGNWRRMASESRWVIFSQLRTMRCQRWGLVLSRVRTPWGLIFLHPLRLRLLMPLHFLLSRSSVLSVICSHTGRNRDDEE